MRNTVLTLLLIALGILLFAWQGPRLVEKVNEPDEEPGELPSLAVNEELLTVNTTRIGSDDPVETAVAVSNIIYPATEPENIPHAVILVGMDSLAEALVATSRIQHFPVNAPILYVTPDGLPGPTRDELLRLRPEGVPADGNVQVYLVGETAAALNEEVEGLGLKTRTFTAGDPAERRHPHSRRGRAFLADAGHVLQLLGVRGRGAGPARRRRARAPGDASARFAGAERRGGRPRRGRYARGDGRHGRIKGADTHDRPAT